VTQALRCVVFDLDDTLYLERDYVRSGFASVGHHVLAAFGVEGFQTAAWEEFEAGHRGDIFNRALERFGLDSGKEIIEELVELYRTHLPDIQLQPDAASCLEALNGRVKVGLISDGPLASQRAKVEALDISDRLDGAILTAEMGSDFGKPHPRAFEEMERMLETRGSECVYVADNPAKDFSGPKSLGWRTVRVRRPLGLYSFAASGDDVDAEVAALQTDSNVMG